MAGSLWLYHLHDGFHHGGRVLHDFGCRLIDLLQSEKINQFFIKRNSRYRLLLVLQQLAEALLKGTLGGSVLFIQSELLLNAAQVSAEG